MTRLRRGAALGLLAVGIERGVSFVVTLYLARRLGPDAFGRWVFVTAGLAPVLVMADQGIEVAAVARMAAHPGAVRATTAWVLGMRLVLAAGAAGGLGWWLLPALADDPNVRAAALAASLLVATGAAMPLRSALRAQGALGAMTAVVTADALLGAAGVVLGTRLVDPVVGALALRAAASAMLVVPVAVWAMAARRPAGGAPPGLVAEAGPLALNALLIALTYRAGHLVLMQAAGAVAVGLLGAAARVAEVLGLVADGVMLAVFPRMAAAPRGREVLARRTARVLALGVGAAIVVLHPTAGAVVRVLFGTALESAAAPLRILVWGGLLATTGNVILHGIVAAGHQRVVLATNVVACLATVALQLVCVGRFGLAGAAGATVAGAACGQLLLLVPPGTRRIVAIAWQGTAPALVATLVGVAVGAGVGGGPLGAAVGLAGFAAVAGLTVGRDRTRLPPGAGIL